MRGFFDGKPLPQSTRSSVLRAIARTFIEARHLPLEKDARHDPVELIASALDIAILQWNCAFRLLDECSLESICADVGVRIAAFEMLFRLPASSHGPWPRVLDALRKHVGGATSRCRDVFLEAKRQAGSRLAMGARDHRDAVLATVVVLGSAARVLEPPRSALGIAIDIIDVDAVAVTYARGVVLLEMRRIEDSFAAFTSMLARSPAWVLALEQAARCCDALGEPARAAVYSRTARRRGRALSARPKKWCGAAPGALVAPRSRGDAAVDDSELEREVALARLPRVSATTDDEADRVRIDRDSGCVLRQAGWERERSR